MSATHHLIAAREVEGAPVFGADGQKLGKISELLIDKASGAVAYILMSFDGFFGMGERYYPIPWAMLRYDDAKKGFAAPLTLDQIGDGMHVDDKEVADEIEWRERVHAYYGVSPYWRAPRL